MMTGRFLVILLFATATLLLMLGVRETEAYGYARQFDVSNNTFTCIFSTKINKCSIFEAKKKTIQIKICKEISHFFVLTYNLSFLFQPITAAAVAVSIIADTAVAASTMVNKHQ
jgi:hypothetical protein